ncbi:MAG: RNA-binding cell elongation regulator Jag/EloR [Eubacteriales bacterium]
MEKFIIKEGKTIDIAVSSALEELKMDRTSVSVEVLETPKSGFLGFGASPAKVKVTYEADETVVAPAGALGSASRSKPKTKATTDAPKAPENAYVPKNAPKPMPKAATSAPKAEPKPVAPAPKKAEPKKTEPKPVKEHRPHVPTPAPLKEYSPVEVGSVEEQIETFIKGLLEHMGSDAVPHAYKHGDNYMVDLVGENLGMLIGHRGDTLDAIQHLANYAVNRGAEKRARINVDAESYRRRREEALERLANKVAAKVVKFRRNVTLEPMNAYERHVIHAALQEVDDVTTYSTGSEPNRRIVVAYSKFKSVQK